MRSLVVGVAEGLCWLCFGRAPLIACVIHVHATRKDFFQSSKFLLKNKNDLLR